MMSGGYFNRVSSDYRRYSRWTSSEELLKAEFGCLREFSDGALIVADAGAGTCRYLEEIYARKVYKSARLVAVDNSLSMISSVPRLSPNISRLLGDLHYLPFCDFAVDRIIGRQVLHYVDLARALREVRRALRSSGIFHSTQQVDYSDVPDQWYVAWSALRGAPERQRLSDGRLTHYAEQAGFREVHRLNVPVRLEYTWPDLAFKYGQKLNTGSLERFFRDTPKSIQKCFDFIVTAEGVGYTSMFRVSTFDLRVRD
jgi:SAM-dependent methyltransferase